MLLDETMSFTLTAIEFYNLVSFRFLLGVFSCTLDIQKELGLNFFERFPTVVKSKSIERHLNPLWELFSAKFGSVFSQRNKTTNLIEDNFFQSRYCISFRYDSNNSRTNSDNSSNNIFFMNPSSVFSNCFGKINCNLSANLSGSSESSLVRCKLSFSIYSFLEILEYFLSWHHWSPLLESHFVSFKKVSWWFCRLVSSLFWIFQKVSSFWDFLSPLSGGFIPFSRNKTSLIIVFFCFVLLWKNYFLSLGTVTSYEVDFSHQNC